jgi:cytochrome c6
MPQRSIKTNIRTGIIAAAMVLLVSAASTGPLYAHDGVVYKAKCASCHGADGTGNTPVGKSLKLRDFHSADVQKLTDAELTKIISAGKGKMPAYAKKLTAEEIQCLVSFIRAMK